MSYPQQHQPQVSSCPYCNRPIQLLPELTGQIVACPHCRQQLQMPGSSVAPPPPPEVQQPVVNPYAAANYSGRRQKPRQQDNQLAMMLGLAGSVMMLVGFFCPVIRIPIMGGVSYMTMVSKQVEGANFNELGLIGLAVAAFAVFGFIVSLLRVYFLNFVPAAVALIAVLLTLMKFWDMKAQMNASMKKDLAGNPFAGIGQLMAEAVQLDFGIGLIVVAGMLLIGAAAVGLMNTSPSR